MQVIALDRITDAQFAASLDARRRFDEEAEPGIPPMAEREWRARISPDCALHNSRHHHYAAMVGDQVVGLAHLSLRRSVLNAHVAACEVSGPDDARRVLLAEMCHVALDDGRTSLMADGLEGDVEDRFWTGLGLSHRFVERVSVLDVTAVDPHLMAKWAETRSERTAGIELVRWTGATPEEWVPQTRHATSAMRDAPLDDLDYTPEDVTVERLRTDEAALAEMGQELEVILAVDPSGRAAGITILEINLDRPAASWQSDTVVVPEFRQRGIGRWLKAEMWQQLRALRPEVTRLRTGNAASNAAMLSINVEMGFTPFVHWGVWQGDLADLQSRLG